MLPVGSERAIAMTFAQNNYHVFLNCRHSISELESVKSAIEAIPYGSCDIFIGDVGNPHSVKELYEMIYTKYDCLDVLVNNAGIAHIGLLSDMSDEEWCNLLDTNLSSVFYCSREAIPKMVSKKSGKNYQHILDVGNKSAPPAKLPIPQQNPVSTGLRGRLPKSLLQVIFR